ncbi:RNA polymerase sigma factor YlaC [Anaerohalosphaera lusitana]|uniref:RNA polymerase sigma factor YlaC n=1 Tax=Anaerohalosphaera lusitana TaxID=1936003 RepID=A0A1U9NR09_9BACT|nr:sigma-70 family RNA polymerase sigma factor [Anaerohalosphaera lusitana]AQT70184.1 RNA polymerase sigma factor YlaC [Anaerohalosphaera lusitana]
MLSNADIKLTREMTGSDMNACVQLACREPSALAHLYDRYYDRIFRFCVYRVGSRTVAEDICSAVWVSVAKSIKHFQGDGETDFRKWIYTIAVNEVNSYYRKTARRNRHLRLLAENADDEQLSEDSTYPQWRQVQKALKSLKTRQQSIIMLRFFEKMSFDEIAEIVGVRASTVRVTLHRSLKKLQKKLESQMEQK